MAMRLTPAATTGMAAATAMECTVCLGISFATGVMRRVANVTLEVMRLVALEVVERRRSAFRERTVVPMPWVVTVINVAIKTTRPMEPRAGPNKDAAIEPVRTVVTIGSAIVGSVIKVPIGARRRNANAHAH